MSPPLTVKTVNQLIQSETVGNNTKKKRNNSKLNKKICIEVLI